MDKQKKCLVVLTDVNMGGVTTAAVNFCNELIKHNDSVDVLLMSDDCGAVNSLSFDKTVNIIYLTGLDKLWNLNNSTIRKQKNPVKKVILFTVGCIKKLINKKSRWIRLLFGKRKRFFGYDVVIAYRQCAPCYHFALNCVEAEKTVAFIHGDIDFMGDISTWQKYMYDFDAVAYVSDAVKNGFVREYPGLEKNAITVYNMFDIENIMIKSQKDLDIDIKHNKFNIVTVSRIENTMKGTGRITHICKMLKDKYGDKFHWYVVGDGPDLDINKRHSFKLEVNDSLTFVGSRDNPYNVMKKCDLCVLPTLTEAFPMIVGESLILGIPVVTSKYPAAGEIIVDGWNGLIADQSIESIFEKICYVIDNKELCDRLKKNCEDFEYDNERSYGQLMNAIYK